MTRIFPVLVAILALLWVGLSGVPPRPARDNVDYVGFGKLPVLVGGRVKPLDTVARNSLLIIHGKESLRLTNGTHVAALPWLADLVFNMPHADRYPAFPISNADVLGLFGWEQTDRKYFSYAELRPFLREIEEQGALSDKLQSVERSAYQNAILNLRNALFLYQRLASSFPAGTIQTGAQETPADVAREIQREQELAQPAYILALPPRISGSGEWRSIGQSVLASVANSRPEPVAQMYQRIRKAYRAKNEQQFNQQVHALSRWMSEHESAAVKRTSFEFFFNRVDPFTHSMVLYLLAFLLACGSWLVWQRPLNRAAFYLLVLALVVHTLGLVSRMYLQERPPVTNLYSSAIFIGWGAVIVALILERLYRDGIGAVCAGVTGFITLIIAHHLAGSGDTLEMLQAVLDTNLWLATHVVAITTGYSAMFLAGMLAIIYIVRGVFTRSLNRAVAQALTRMTYGVVCFATFFSFVGTVLGGIWADQSWGRFWGWDPKENGAVLIVLWCAMILHARWGGFIHQRGLMMMAVFGNVITSFSWFGVNMLGVGLHSYGFMEKAFPWLCGFIASQLALIGLAALPLEHWRSFRLRQTAPPGNESGPEIIFTSPELAIETK
jgi:ABC-type transport system involved in cytochrome c biogenesis permease subunit